MPVPLAKRVGEKFSTIDLTESYAGKHGDIAFRIKRSQGPYDFNFSPRIMIRSIKIYIRLSHFHPMSVNFRFLPDKPWRKIKVRSFWIEEMFKKKCNGRFT